MGQARPDFLRRLLPFQRGIPSHDTFDDVMDGLDAELCELCFAGWVMAVIRHCAMELVRAGDDEHSPEVCREKADLDPACLASLTTARRSST